RSEPRRHLTVSISVTLSEPIVPLPFRLGFIPVEDKGLSNRVPANYRGVDRGYFLPEWGESRPEGGWSPEWIALTDAPYERSSNVDLELARRLVDAVNATTDVRLELVYVEVVYCLDIVTPARRNALPLFDLWLPVHDAARKPDDAVRLGIDISTPFPTFNS